MRGTCSWAILALVAVALGLGGWGCGAGSSASAANAGFDEDDGGVRYFGHPAGPADFQAIAAVVERYFRAAAAGDGAEGCSLLYSLVAETLVDDYGQVPSVRGDTCAQVLSKLFRVHHGEAGLDLAKFKPFSIRVEGNRALALYRLAPTNVHRMEARREHGRWTVSLLLDAGLP
jgi:hypothetical protein